MEDHAHRAVAIVGVGAVLPDAPNAKQFWDNVSKPDDTASSRRRPTMGSGAVLLDCRFHKSARQDVLEIGGWIRDFGGITLAGSSRFRRRLATRWTWSEVGGRRVAQALIDYGPDRPLNPDRTAVIFGNAMAGDPALSYVLARILPRFA